MLWERKSQLFCKPSRTFWVSPAPFKTLLFAWVQKMFISQWSLTILSWFQFRCPRKWGRKRWLPENCEDWKRENRCQLVMTASFQPYPLLVATWHRTGGGSVSQSLPFQTCPDCSLSAALESLLFLRRPQMTQLPLMCFPLPAMWFFSILPSSVHLPTSAFGSSLFSQWHSSTCHLRVQERDWCSHPRSCSQGRQNHKSLFLLIWPLLSHNLFTSLCVQVIGFFFNPVKWDW